MDIFIIILLIAVAIKLISTRTKYSLHMAQLEGYDPELFKKWIENNKDKAYSLQKSNQPVKKPLVFTQRATRLFRANLFLNGLILLVPSIIYLSTNNGILYAVILVLFY